MRTAYLGILLLTVASGCSTALADRSPAVASGFAAHGELISSAAVHGSTPAGCLVSGENRTIAENVRVRGGIELASTSNRFSVGFTTGPHDAVAVDVDPSSGSVTRSISRHSSDAIRHVTPLGAERGELDTAVDTASKSNGIELSRMVPARQPFVIGTTDRHVAWASSAAGAAQLLWPLPEGPIFDLSAIPVSGGQRYAVIFRQGDSLWLGRLDSNKKALGPLSKIAERSHLRTPTLAESGDTLLVAWAEQPSIESRGSLGGARVAANGAVSTVRFELPAGGLGGDAMLPSLAGVRGGRFLLVWTEGPASARDVRAVTVDSSGVLLGPALEVSAGTDSILGRPVVGTDGRGAIVFVSTKDGGFSLVSRGITCPVGSPEDGPVLANAREDHAR